MFAGQRYYERLLAHVRRRSITLEAPLQGLRISEHRNWLGARGMH